MKAFRITGTFKMGEVKDQPFTREITADSKNQAHEKILSNIGSRHKVSRKLIKIKKIEEIGLDEATDLVVKGLLEGL